MRKGIRQLQAGKFSYVRPINRLPWSAEVASRSTEKPVAENPYASPGASASEEAIRSFDRRGTQGRWRAALAILFVPAAVQFGCHLAFDFIIKPYLAYADAVVYLVIFALIWKWSFTWLERLTLLTQRLVAPRSSPDTWRRALASGLELGPYIAGGIALLWLAGIAGAYYLR